MIIKPELVKLNLSPANKEEALKALSNLLLENGIVRDSFYDAVIEREKKFPTGLRGKYINFSLPHTDAEHVNKTALAIATLDNKVEFNSMEGSSDVIEVELILMLAIDKPQNQVNVLKNLLEVVQKKEFVTRLKKKEHSVEEIVALFKSKFS